MPVLLEVGDERDAQRQRPGRAGDVGHDVVAPPQRAALPDDPRRRVDLTFRIVSYNVENLFDSRHDTLKNDYEFLPDATRHWNYSKYRKKLDNIAASSSPPGMDAGYIIQFLSII